MLDTWFSSSLWPFSTLGWPDKTEDLEKYYPNDVLETGHDIIFFWVAKMIIMGIELTGKVPFHTIYLHGLVRDENGDKKEATILWFEPTLDLAIVKVEGSNYPVMELGDSDNIQVGELAVAIGNPLGLQFKRTVTTGIISGLNRTKRE